MTGARSTSGFWQIVQTCPRDLMFHSCDMAGIIPQTACSGACAKLPLGLGCPASVVITGCGQDNSYGGTPWKTSLEYPPDEVRRRRRTLVRCTSRSPPRPRRKSGPPQAEKAQNCRAFRTPARYGFSPPFCAPPLPSSFPCIPWLNNRPRPFSVLPRPRLRTPTDRRPCPPGPGPQRTTSHLSPDAKGQAARRVASAAPEQGSTACRVRSCRTPNRR